MKSGKIIALTALLAITVAGCAPRRPQNIFENLSPSVGDVRGLKWNTDEARAAISGRTFLRHQPGVGHEVIYFAANGTAYSWKTGVSYVKSALWTVQMRALRPTDQARPYICMSWPQYDSAGKAIPGPTQTQCIQPALLFVPAADSQPGDAFGIAEASAAPFELPVEKKTIAGLKQ